MNRCEENWNASDNTLCGTPRGSQKKPYVGRQPTGCLSTAVLCRGLETNSMVRAWHGHGHGMASVNQTRPHCVNQMGKTHSKPLVARHGRGTAWARHAMCESAFREASSCTPSQRISIRTSTKAKCSLQYPKATRVRRLPNLQIISFKLSQSPSTSVLD
jgi:hypothetical protein